MDEYRISDAGIQQLDAGERVTINNQSFEKYDSDDSMQQSTGMKLLPQESVDLLNTGQEVVFDDLVLLPEGVEYTESEPSTEDRTDSHEAENDRRDDLTRIDIDTSMLRQLATGSVTIELELSGEQWDELAAGGSVVLGDDYELRYIE